MKKIRNLSALLLAATLVASGAACGGSSDPGQTSNSSSGGSTGTVVNIDQDVYNALSADYQFDTNYIKQNKSKFSGTLYMARAYGDELPGWEYVYDAYEKMYPNITIENAEYTSGNAMKSALITQMSSGAESIGLVQGNYVQDQLGQYGYNFQGGFVDTVNPYASPAGEEVLIGDLINDYTFCTQVVESIVIDKVTN